MSAPIAYDLLRLFLGPWMVTPRGIDRIDLCYARFFFEAWAGDCGGTLPTPWGVRWYDRRRVLQLLDRVEELWSETVQPGEDRVLLRVKEWLSGKPEPETKHFRQDASALRFSGIPDLEPSFGNRVLVWCFRCENRAQEFHLSKCGSTRLGGTAHHLVASKPVGCQVGVYGSRRHPVGASRIGVLQGVSAEENDRRSDRAICGRTYRVDGCCARIGLQRASGSGPSRDPG